MMSLSIPQTLIAHLDRLAEVLDRFRAAGLKLKPAKCELLQPQVSYLGHVVSADGVSTDPEKIEAVKDWKTPTCVSEVRAFLGFVGYYQRFIPDFATVAKPLNRLTSKKSDFSWGEEEEFSFQQLRRAMISTPVLAYPSPEAGFIVDTDASNDAAVHAVLSQCQGGEERAIAYYSKTFSMPPNATIALLGGSCWQWLWLLTISDPTYMVKSLNSGPTTPHWFGYISGVSPHTRWPGGSRYSLSSTFP